jgi:hypothetical protein
MLWVTFVFRLIWALFATFLAMGATLLNVAEKMHAGGAPTGRTVSLWRNIKAPWRGVGAALSAAKGGTPPAPVSTRPSDGGL